MEEPIRIAVIDDHTGVRAGIKSLFDKEKDIVVVGEGATGIDALQLVIAKEPDILLLDEELPLLKGHEVAKRINEMGLEVQILAVSSYDDRDHIFGMLENGASGYITKDEVPKFLLNAVRFLSSARTETWLSPRAKNRLANKKDVENHL